jgi:hypothetical protein
MKRLLVTYDAFLTWQLFLIIACLISLTTHLFFFDTSTIFTPPGLFGIFLGVCIFQQNKFMRVESIREALWRRAMQRANEFHRMEYERGIREQAAKEKKRIPVIVDGDFIRLS